MTDSLVDDHGMDADLECLYSGVLSSAYLEMGNHIYCTDYELAMYNIWAEQQNRGPARFIGWRPRGFIPRHWLP